MKKMIILLIVFQFFTVLASDAGKKKSAQHPSSINLKASTDKQISNITNNNVNDNLKKKESTRGKSKVDDSSKSSFIESLSEMIVPGFITLFFGSLLFFLLSKVFSLSKEMDKKLTNDDLKKLESNIVSLEAFKSLSDNVKELRKCRLCNRHLNIDMFLEASYEFNKGNLKIAEIYLYDELIRNPNHPNAWVRLSEIYFKFNRFNEALYSINRALELDAHDPKLNEEGGLDKIKAEILMKLGEYKEAINILEDILEKNPAYKEAKSLLNQCIEELEEKAKIKSSNKKSKKSVKKAAKKFSKGEKDE